MVRALSVGAILTFTGGTTRYSCIKTFTVFFLALTFLAVAALPVILFLGTCHLMLDNLSGLTNRLVMFLVVVATITSTFFSTDLPR